MTNGTANLFCTHTLTFYSALQWSAVFVVGKIKINGEWVRN